MNSLPYELVDMISDYLSVRDKCHLTLTCAALYSRNKSTIKWFTAHLQCMQTIINFEYYINEDYSVRLYSDNIVAHNLYDDKFLEISNFKKFNTDILLHKRMHVRVRLSEFNRYECERILRELIPMLSKKYH